MEGSFSWLNHFEAPRSSMPFFNIRAIRFLLNFSIDGGLSVSVCTDQNQGFCGRFEKITLHEIGFVCNIVSRIIHVRIPIRIESPEP